MLVPLYAICLSKRAARPCSAGRDDRPNAGDTKRKCAFPYGDDVAGRSSQAGRTVLAGGSLARSAPFSSSFLRLGRFLAGWLRRPRPSAGIPQKACGTGRKSLDNLFSVKRRWLKFLT